MRAAPPAPPGDSTARTVAHERPSLHDESHAVPPDAGVERPADARVADEMLVAGVVAGAWFAIGTGVALMLAGRGAPIFDVAIALSVAVAGTLATLSLLAHVATDED